MIAVVTSTIKPADSQNKGLYSFEERLYQTQQTLTSLGEHGFETIYLIDNSPSLNQTKLQQILVDFAAVEIYHILQYQFANKGINELLMLLFLSEHLPPNQQIFKISGRYYPIPSFTRPDFSDFAAKTYAYLSKTGTISTRGYWVKDAITLQHFLQSCLTEVFAYPQRITGFRSLLKTIGPRFFHKWIGPVNISIEFAAANILKKEKYALTQLTDIGIEGLVAGASQLEKIIE